MLDTIGIMAAVERTRELAGSALPNAPVRPDAAETRSAAPAHPVRQRVSLGLRRLADLVEPGRERLQPMAPTTANPCG